MTKDSRNNRIHMMHLRKFLYTGLWLLVPFYNNLFAQSAVSASGGNGTGSGGSVSYTIGQVAYTNFTGEPGSINLGVQQPNLFLMVGLEDADITLSASLFPNPTHSSASLKLVDQNASIIEEGLAFRLYDINGKLLLQQDIEAEITTIPMEDLTGSVFIVQVTRKDIEIKSFKIFKTN